MAPEQFDALRQAREEYLRKGIVDATVRPFVADSWTRCRLDGIHPRTLRQQRLDLEQTRAAREQAQELFEAAEPIMREVSGIVGAQPHIVALSDARGLILRLMGDPESTGPAGAAANLFEGASWAEHDIGCNGIGTALYTASPVVLIGAEHFQEAYLDWTCIGIPLRNRDDVVVGAIDLSVPNEYANASTWGWMLSVARAIEDRLRSGVLGAERAPQPTRPFDSVRGILEMIGTHMDSGAQQPLNISDLKRKINETEEQLLSAVAALRERSERLESVSRYRDESMAVLAHELRGPLFAVLSCVELLRNNGHDQETVDWARTVLERQASQMRTLVEDLADLSRAERGKIQLNVQEIDLAEIVDQAALTIQQELRERGISLERRVPHIGLRADRTRMVQIMTNLLGNAARYNRDGGRITVIAQPVQEQVEIRVADTGMGIEPELLPRIFEPFVQGRMRDRGGLGLGLSLVRRLVELHGGSISIHSEGAGKGVEVVVRLPISVGAGPGRLPHEIVRTEGEMTT